MKKNTWNLMQWMTLAVFTLFALCLLLVLLSGAGVCRRVAARTREGYALRTAVQYLSTRVRQAQGTAVTDFEGCQALTLSEETDGRTYLTRVYWYEGAIRELYCRQDAALSPEDGEEVLEAESLSFSLEGEVLTARVNGRTVVLQLRTGTG